MLKILLIFLILTSVAISENNSSMEVPINITKNITIISEDKKVVLNESITIKGTGICVRDIR